MVHAWIDAAAGEAGDQPDQKGLYEGRHDGSLSDVDGRWHDAYGIDSNWRRPGATRWLCGLAQRRRSPRIRLVTLGECCRRAPGWRGLTVKVRRHTAAGCCGRQRRCLVVAPGHGRKIFASRCGAVRGRIRHRQRHARVCRGAATGERAGTSWSTTRPGGGTVIGSQEVSRARPDGTTVLYTTGGHTTNAVLTRNLPYDPVEGFTAITMLSRSPGFALIVSGGPRGSRR